MNSAFLDPNNHVPEVSQGDDWGDVDGEEVIDSQAFASLPPRRTIVDQSPGMTEGIETGLRIGSTLVRDHSGPSSGTFEVQEITSSVIRLEQEAPAPPKMERIVTFYEKPAFLKGAQSPRGEGREWGKVNRGSNRWIIAMGSTILLVVVSGIALLPKINAPNAIRENPQAMVMPEEDEMPEGMEALNELLECQPAARRVFQSFVHASQPDHIIPLILDGTKQETRLRASWVPSALSPSWQPEGDSDWSVLNLAGHPYGLLEGNFPDSTKYRAYFILKHGQLLLDWAATTAYGTATFEELNSGSGDSSEIRGIISMGDYYTTAFPESVYQSFRLVSPDNQITIWCYLPTDSPAIGHLSSQLQTSLITQETPGPEKITLRLERGPGEAMPNQWLIGDLIHFEWASP